MNKISFKNKNFVFLLIAFIFLFFLVFYLLDLNQAEARYYWWWNRPICYNYDYYACYNNDVYWYDSCGKRQSKKQECGDTSYRHDYRCSGNTLQRKKVIQGCSGSSCYKRFEWVNWTKCGSDSCGSWSSTYCKNGDVYKKRTCHDRGCSGSSCYDRTYTEEKKVEDCAYGCSNGACNTCYCIGTATVKCKTSQELPFGVVATCSVKGGSCATCGGDPCPGAAKQGSCTIYGGGDTCTISKLDCQCGPFEVTMSVSKGTISPTSKTVTLQNPLTETVNFNYLPECIDNFTYGCYNDDVYWYDSCLDRGAKKQECGSDGWLNQYRCSFNGDVERKKIDRGCRNSACYSEEQWAVYEYCQEEECDNWQYYCSRDDLYKRRTCIGGCESGQCAGEDLQVKKARDCGEDSCDDWTYFCQAKSVYRKRTCYDRGCRGAGCFEESNLETEKVEDCAYGCLDGTCIGSCVPGETRACGNCGTQTCQSNYQWGSCEGQGVCSTDADCDDGDPLTLDECKADCSCSNTRINRSPNASIQCRPSSCAVFKGEMLTLLNKSTDPDGANDLDSSVWDVLGWGSSKDLSCSRTCNYTVQSQLLGPGRYTARLTVKDSQGSSDSTTKSFNIYRDASAGFMCSLDNKKWEVCEEIAPAIGDTIYLKDDPSLREYSSHSGGGSNIVGRTWSVGGTIFSQANESNPSFVIQDITNEITLEIRDDADRSASRTHTVVPILPLPSWTEVKPF